MRKIINFLLIALLSFNILIATVYVNSRGGIEFVILTLNNIVTTHELKSVNIDSYKQIEMFKKYPSSKNDIVFVGDSIIKLGAWSEYYPDKSCRNRGISGDTSQGVCDRLEDILDGRPQKIFLSVGINDLASNVNRNNILQNYGKIIEKANGTKLYIFSLLPVNTKLVNGNYHIANKDIMDLNQKIKELCFKNNIVYTDVYKAFIDETGQMKSSLTTDGIHITPEAYLILSEIIKQYMY